MAQNKTRSGKPTRRRLLKVGGAAALGVLAGAGAFSLLKRPRPNIAFIICDALRADRPGMRGPSGSLTPFLDTVTGRGTVFADCIAPSSWTLPSVAGIMTSRNPVVTGSYYTESYASGATTFAEELRKAGYYTLAVVRNPWLPARTAAGELLPTVVRKGFDYYNVGKVKTADNPLHARGIGQAREFLAFPPAEDATDEVIRVLKAAKARGGRRPFCLYLHYMNTHEPYSPSPADRHVADSAAPIEGVPDHLIYKVLRFRGEKRSRNVLTEEDAPLLARAQALYDAALVSVDAAVARLAAYLEKTGEFENTIFIFTADHGEEFGEHGWFGHSITLYEECLHVPLIVWGPGVPRGARITRLVRGVDIAPGICRLAGVPAAVDFEGEALGFVRGDAGPKEAVACTVAPALPRKLKTVTLALRDAAGSKLILKRPAPGVEGPDVVRLFDLARDPGEQDNLAADAASVAALSSRLRKYVAAAARRPQQEPGRQPDEDAIRRLRSLGYL
ncbi:MAG: sulfatase [Planctomycetes bacterium]|nr:sulfatase [Planctomycetota bacterium]